MKINKMITPYNHTNGSIDRIKYIVLHYVGATGSAKSNCNYFMTDGRNASAHYFVNHDGEIWQSVEDKDVAWHCTNKNQYCKNSNSIGIEMCCSKDANGKWYIPDATVKAAAELTRDLMKKYGVPINNIWRHYDCTGKACPEPWVRDPAKWTDFLNSLNAPQGSQNGWKQVGQDWYYYQNGTQWRDMWLQYKHHWYRFGPDGKMLTGWNKVPDQNGVPSWCYFDDTAENIGMEWHERSDGIGFLEIWTTKD